MKKLSILIVMFLGIVNINNAQNISKENLTKHVYYLASDNMRGRAVDSKELMLSAQYIKKELINAGLQPIDFNVNSDSLKYSGSNNKVFHNFYVEIPSFSSQFDDDYILLSTIYSGSGVDTLKKTIEIIKNGANYNASGVASLIEIAKYLKQNQHLLKRNIVVLFSGANNAYIDDYFIENYTKGNYKMSFKMQSLGYLYEDEDENTFKYSLSTSNISNATNILQSIIMEDVDLPAIMEESYDNTPNQISLYGDDLSIYDDVADSLNYDLMTKITNQLTKIIVAFDTSELKIDENIKPYSSDITDWTEFATNTKQNMSYFGLNLMIGSNKHYYTKGNMTGKSAMSYSAGLFYKWQFAKHWALKLDANYERAYANREDGRFKSNVISIPLSILFATGNKYGEVFYGIGGYYDRTLDGKLNNVKLNYDDFKKYEWGWQFNIGFRVNRFIMGYYQKIGISNMMTKSYELNGKIKNRNQYFYIGYKF